MIYLDNAATAKPDETSIKQAEKYLYTEYYNPSALYSEAYNLQLMLKESRKKIVSLIAEADKFSLVFTASGTEADNHAIFCGGTRGNIVTTMGEHSAVYSAAMELKQRGVEVRFAGLNSDGSVDMQSLLKLVDEKTSLVSVVHVNNETGAVNDIIKIAEYVKQRNKYALFHSDGIQAFGKIPFKLTNNIDLYSVSAHKIGGIKGCGALIKRRNLVLKPLIYGGGQEQGLRSGTENVFGIKCFEYASVKRYETLISLLKKVENFNGEFRSRLSGDFRVISGVNSSPYILTLAVRGVRGETILHDANDNGLIIGTGSACSSNAKKRYSRVILACGIDEKDADGILRISFSPDNTEKEITQAVEILNRIVKIRKKKMA